MDLEELRRLQDYLAVWQAQVNEAIEQAQEDPEQIPTLTRDILEEWGKDIDRLRLEQARRDADQTETEEHEEEEAEETATDEHPEYPHWPYDRDIPADYILKGTHGTESSGRAYANRIWFLWPVVAFNYSTGLYEVWSERGTR